MSARCGALDGWRGLGEAAHRAHTVRFTPPPRPSRRPPTSAAPTRSRMAWGPCQSSPGGAPTRHRPPTRPRLPSLAHNGRPAARPARLPTGHCSGCPINLPPAHLPLALPRASDWVPVGRRWARPVARLRNALGWVGRARIFVWSVPAGASGLPPEAAALFLSLSAVPPPSPAVPAPFCRAGRWPGSPSVADLEWVGLGGSGRCCLGREASAISVDRWGKPQNWPRQSPGTRRGIAPLPARRMARFDRLTRFF